MTSPQTGLINQLVINTDGGSRGNPGPAAIGWVIKSDQKIIHQTSRYLGITTNNQAEYQALLDALNWVVTHSAEFTPTPTQLSIACFLDSELIVNQLNRVYKLKHPDLIPLGQSIFFLIKTHQLNITFTHIPRRLNAAADALVNQALDQAYAV
jgi:ribonuclease HI